MQKILIREAKRTNAAYQPHGMAAMADFVEIHNKADLFDEARSIAAPVLETAHDEMDVDGEASEQASISRKQ